MKHSILIRTLIIVTVATLLFFAAGFATLSVTSLRAMQDETIAHAADKIALFQTYISSQTTMVYEYISQFMVGAESRVSSTLELTQFFKECKPQNGLLRTRLLIFDGKIITADTPNTLWKMVVDADYYKSLVSGRRLKVTEPFYSRLCSARAIAIGCSQILDGHEVGLICEIATENLFDNLNNKLSADETLIVMTTAGNTVYFDRNTSLLKGRTAHGNMIDMDESTKEMLMSLPLGTQEIDYQGRKMISETQRLDERWNITILMNNDHFYQAVNKLRSRYFIYGLPAVALLIGVCFAVSASITEPIKNLTRQIDVQPGDWGYTKLVCHSKDEIGRLADSFNHLLQRLEQASREKEEIERANFKMEYKVLQSQIQPHFLFNVHMCIDSLLDQGKTEQARKMLSSLDALLHNSTDKLQSLISLKDEMKMLEQYIDLQKQRSGDTFDMDFGNWEAYQTIEVPKLLLQPIVENSLRHGLSNIAFRGTISLRFDQIDDMLHIFICDNGRGISSDELLAIQQGKEQNTNTNGMVSIGLSNVRSRIKAVYGANGNLYISSRLNLGTTVEIVFDPRIRPEGTVQ